MSDIDPTPEPGPAPEAEQPDQEQPPPEAPDEPLGEKGVRALEAEKEKRRKAAAELREARARIAELETKYGDATERERREFEQGVLTKANDRIRRAEVKAIAAGRLADPADAARFLDLDQFEVGEDGEVDKEAIGEAIDALLKERPYLAAHTGPGPHVQGSINQGVRKAPAEPTLTERIAEAEKAGDWKTSLRLKNQLAFQQSQSN